MGPDEASHRPGYPEVAVLVAITPHQVGTGHHCPPSVPGTHVGEEGSAGGRGDVAQASFVPK